MSEFALILVYGVTTVECLSIVERSVHGLAYDIRLPRTVVLLVGRGSRRDSADVNCLQVVRALANDKSAVITDFDDAVGSEVGAGMDWTSFVVVAEVNVVANVIGVMDACTMFALVAFVANRLPVNRDIHGDDHVAAEDELAGGGLKHGVDGAAECEGGDLEEVIVVRWGVAGKFKVHELVSDILVYDPVGAFEDGVGLGVANGGGLWFDAV